MSEQRHYPPMLLSRAWELPQGDEWAFEPKYDGHRTMAEIAIAQEGGPAVARFTTRRNNDSTARYPTVAQALLQAFDGRQIVVDGEMIGFNSQSQLDFNELARRRPRAVLIIFDVLEVEGERLTELPLAVRRPVLEQLYVAPQANVLLTDMFADGEGLADTIADMRLEGVVAKRLDSRYIPGKRSHSWLKYLINPHVVKARSRRPQPPKRH